MGQPTTAGIKISADGSKLMVESPYNPDFIEVAKQANGRWSSPCWVFDIRDEPRIREACLECYGTDGAEVPTVDVRVDLDVFTDLSGPSWFLFGRLLVERKARDYRAKLGPGVVVISGGFPDSGGSMKNPRPAERAGTVLEVRDVPAGLARKLAAAHDGIEILETGLPAAADPAAEEQCWAILEKLQAKEALAILAKLQARISTGESAVTS